MWEFCLASTAPFSIRQNDSKGQKKCRILQKKCKKKLEQMEQDDFGSA